MGLNAAITRNVISATMAHLVPFNGSRFVYSHDFSDLLVGQMEATLEDEISNVCIQSNKLGVLHANVGQKLLICYPFKSFLW